MLFEKPSLATLEKLSLSRKNSFKINFSLDTSLVNSTKSNDCPIPLFLVSIMVICIDPDMVNLVLVG